MPSAISFPLPGGFGTFTLKKRAPPGAPQKNPRPVTGRGLYYLRKTTSYSVRAAWPIHVPFNGGKPASPTNSSRALRRRSAKERLTDPVSFLRTSPSSENFPRKSSDCNSGVIFIRLYWRRAPTIPGSLGLSSADYCLRLRFSQIQQQLFFVNTHYKENGRGLSR